MPDDAKYLFWWSTRSKEEEILRIIREKKFYATLPDKLDAAEKRWHKAQPEDKAEEQWQTTETGTFGQDGWSISTSYKPLIPDD